jgi:hypothetical protein
MKITKSQLKQIIKEELSNIMEVIDNPVRGSLSADDAIAMARASDKRLGLPDEGPYEDLITALQGTFYNQRPRNLGASTMDKLGKYYPDEAKELMAMSPNKQDSILAMAFPSVTDPGW